MRSNPSSPYGRPPLAQIPVPPFENEAAVSDYRRQLAIYVAGLGRGRDVGLAEFALCATIDAIDIADASGALTPVALRLSLAVAFPVAWTPQALLVAIMTARGKRAGFWKADGDQLIIGGDPGLSYERRTDGGWTLKVEERGQERIEGQFASDDDLVLALGEEEVTGHTYPYGWSTRPYDLRVLGDAAAQAHDAFARHARLPYLREWNTPKP